MFLQNEIWVDWRRTGILLLTVLAKKRFPTGLRHDFLKSDGCSRFACFSRIKNQVVSTGHLSDMSLMASLWADANLSCCRLIGLREHAAHNLSKLIDD
ncbi:MAG TPA: hypothetical protein VNJ07_14070 [Chitinophagales bacterium]|nr:hypothetical protein [Chitinophagales bacterium]